MATKTGYISAPAGCNAAKAFNTDTDTVAANGTATTVTAGVNDPTHYTVVFTDLAAGSYRLVLFNGTDPVLAADITVGSTTWTPPQSTGDASLANQVTMLSLLNAIKLKTDTIGTVSVSVTGYAQLADGVLILKQGHTATLTFTGSSADLVPNLTGEKCFLGIKDAAGRTWLSIEGTVVTPTGTQVLQFTLTPSVAKTLEEGEHFFDVVAVYGYNATISPPYTALEVFTSGRAHVDRLHVNIT